MRNLRPRESNLPATAFVYLAPSNLRLTGAAMKSIIVSEIRR